MRKNYVKLPLLIAALYFGGDLHAQSTQDTTAKESKIEEVVVIGYGTRKKVDNTTAISSIGADEVSKTKVLNASQAIQGKAAGVQVTASDMPGSTPTVMVRGLGTVTGGREPLFVVDGMFTNNINNINSNDILSYDILKDAAALAIYGNRAANGVIIITTKSGKGKLSVEYDGLIGIRNPLKKVKMANAQEFVNYNNIANSYLATPGRYFSTNQPYNTDWFKEITRTGIYNQHNLSVSGSSESAKYFFSLNNYDEQSILKGTDYNRTTFRTNNEFKLSKRITLSQNLNVSFTNVTPKPLSAFTNAYKQSPLVPVRYPSGQYGIPFIDANGNYAMSGSRFNNVGNPVSQLDFNNEKNKTMLMQGMLKLDVEIMKGLKFTSNFNGEYSNFKSYNFSDGLGIFLAGDPNRLATQYTDSARNTLTNTKNDYYNWLLSNVLNYNRTFGNHNIDAMIGTEASVKSGVDGTVVARKNLGYVSNYWNLDGQNYINDIVALNSTQGNRNTTLSYFARAQYKLMNRYLISATVRRDGSSQFAEGNKWGTFPSFGAGWIISEESFLKDGFFNLLKLRGGWGRLGNQNVPLSYLPISSGTSYNYAFGGNPVSNGVTINKGLDPTLGWEITEESSLGLDFGVLNNRLTGTFDVYDRKTTNLILPVTNFITSGQNVEFSSHVGSVTNKGLEASLTWADKVGEDFSYSIGANYSFNNNELTRVNDSNISAKNGGSLGNGQWTKLFNRSTVGHALGSFYLWEADGYDADGNIKYKDFDNDGVTGSADADDRKYFDSYIPKSTMGLNISMNYKNFDFNLSGYGAFGFSVYNGKKAQRISGENIEASVANDFWTTSNTNAGNPKPYTSIPIASTFFLEKGDYFRINNISVGYTFRDVVDYVKSVRFYVSAINPVIFTKYSGYTSELNGDGDPYGSTGVELDSYPALRSFVFGLNVNF
ncbi:SusC/RagA family TonB-linked outer membrane protein [Epilithonimonas ginsengisoli]|uniref:SusC/RagA family TonB-linked outer membrane protein n=1 Tax=Epilithonimonas ginsengisoli TaxID=1245592 RepID=A0ABU4JM43_9FLAO|nr:MULTISPECIES: SusC/RagA family TonB-linked outer membrane protein [Chryseobacterium group]MBV6881717.1 SusC/RagA family TonB-linked outer membrane protein [Epilithonimonas sp. FP105]MDW8550753.1 SusC/RagA family TonB-linked outer membrane protein [Epilithonimonas ginsengisoli]OAH66305.1 SusC/RagA family TonB-linked outer membrane protein [Chryseobacterium sp. FP211-J200]